MVLGQPVALIAEFLYMPGCFNAAGNRCACSLSWPERYEIQDRERNVTHPYWMISEAKGRRFSAFAPSELLNKVCSSRV
jgi:hypothetical protein